MNNALCKAIGTIALSAPFLIIAAILSHYFWRRIFWKRKARKDRKSLGFCPSSAALATAFLLIPAFYRPSVVNLIEARQRMDVEEDDEGGPDTSTKNLQRQLRRIRNGEQVERLIVWR